MENYNWMRPGVKAVFVGRENNSPEQTKLQEALAGTEFTISSTPMYGSGMFANKEELYVSVEEKAAIQSVFDAVFPSLGLETSGFIACICLQPLHKPSELSWDDLAKELGIDPTRIAESV